MRARRRRSRFVWDAIGLVLFLVIAFPVYWMVASAFKPDDELNGSTPTWFSFHPTLSHFRDAINKPFFWDGVKNSLIVVSVTVALAMVLAFLAAVALAKFRFTGRKAFIVLIIGIQMLPQAGLIIPLYVVLARYHQVNALSGVIVTYMTFVLPFSVWVLRGFLLGIPKELEEAAMVDGSSRLGAFSRILLPARGARPGGDVDLRLHHDLERVHLCPRPAQRPVEADGHGLALLLLRHEPQHGLGRPNGGLDADRDPGDRLLPDRAAEDRVRADGRRGPRLSDAAACLFPGFDGETVPDWLKRLLAEGLGGVVLYGQNITDTEQVAELTASLRAERPELIVATDEEGGDVTRLEAGSGSSFPGNFALGAVDDPALTRRVGAAIGGELAAVGIDLDLAPVADVLVDPASAIVGVRSFGSDPQVVARQVAAFVEGLQSVGVAACAKHFPGHGETVADSHLELPSSEAGLDVLRERALPPFAAAIEAGVRVVMTAHIRFVAFGEAPATWNSAVVELLRTELGFDGVVMTDALEMQGAGGPEEVDHSAVRALAAGADALCLGAVLTPEQVEGVLAAVGAAVPEERLAEAARRVGELAAWTSPRPLQDRQAGAEAARRALRVEGDPAVSAEHARRRAPGRAVDRGRRVRPRSRRAARR